MSSISWSLHFALFSTVLHLVKTEPEEFSTIWNSEDTNSFDGTAIKMEDNDNGLGSDSNYMDGGSSMYFIIDVLLSNTVIHV